MSHFQNQKALAHFSKAQLRKMLIAKQNQIDKLKSEHLLLKEKLSVMSSFDEHNEQNFSLRQIIALMPGTVFWKNRAGIYLGCNNNLAKFLGLASPDDFIGKRNEDLMSISLAEPLNKIDEDIMRSGQETFVEEVGVSHDHQPTVFFTQKVPLYHQSEVIGLLGISIDITERKRIEKELQVAKEKAEISNRAKSEFLATINHELRTPLTGILGLVNLLQQDHQVADKTKKRIDDLENCARYLLALVNNVLDFSQLDAGKKSINASPVNLKKSVNEVMNMMTVLAKEKQLALHTSIDESIPQLIVTDELLLHQILINIINNAIKFTDEGHVTLQLRCLKQTDHGVQLEISIHDTGKGIPADQINAIFEPFQQIENPYIRASSRAGAGLGLAIVKKLAELLRINISVASEIGKGTSFYLTGEYEVYEKKSGDASRVNQKKSQQKKGLKILLVEDDEMVQHIHRVLLNRLNCHVDVAGNGCAALQLIDRHDLIFVDIGLPDMSGFDLIKKIREQLPYKTLPIIALTGYTGEQEKSACLMAGANEVVTKPVSENELSNLMIRYT